MNKISESESESASIAFRLVTNIFLCCIIFVFGFHTVPGAIHGDPGCFLAQVVFLAPAPGGNGEFPPIPGQGLMDQSRCDVNYYTGQALTCLPEESQRVQQLQGGNNGFHAGVMVRNHAAGFYPVSDIGVQPPAPFYGASNGAGVPFTTAPMVPIPAPTGRPA